MKSLQAFLDHLAHERRLSSNTITAYRRDLDAFAAELQRIEITDPAKVNEHQVRALIARRHRQGLGPRSIQRLLSSIRSFYRYLMREGLSGGNPAAAVKAPKAPKKLPQTLDTDAVARLLDFEAATPLAIRDKAIMELFYSSGLRLSELATLRWDELDLASGLLRVTGKGNKTRMVPIGSVASKALVEWRKVRGNFAGFEQPCIFVSNRGTPISVRTIQSRIRYWAKKQGLPQQVHPHLLRHSLASHKL